MDIIIVASLVSYKVDFKKSRLSKTNYIIIKIKRDFSKYVIHQLL